MQVIEYECLNCMLPRRIKGERNVKDISRDFRHGNNCSAKYVTSCILHCIIISQSGVNILFFYMEFWINSLLFVNYSGIIEKIGCSRLKVTRNIS
jgi:hypothetical protein